MSLSSAFSDFWNSLTSDSSVDAFSPMVNIDGTPMLDSTIDIHGNPFGVTDAHSPVDTGMSFDSGTDWSSGDAFSDFS